MVTTPSLDEPDVFQVFSAKRRRTIMTILSLYDVGDTVTLRNIARLIGAIEQTENVGNVHSDTYQSVYNSLIQTHIPKLDDVGYLDYDEREKAVTVIEETSERAKEVMMVRSQIE